MVEIYAGARFGRWTATANTISGPHWVKRECICDCGTIKFVANSSLHRGASNSCGCLNREVLGNRSRTHGRSRCGHSRAYKAWQHAKSRCYNPNDAKYPRYGARGIKMCDAWRGDFTAFLADLGEPPAGKSLERVDLDGDYEPGNCEWATAKAQMRNTSKNVWMPGGIVLSDFCTAHGLPRKQFSYHYRKKGRSIHEAAEKCGVILSLPKP